MQAHKLELPNATCMTGLSVIIIYALVLPSREEWHYSRSHTSRSCLLQPVRQDVEVAYYKLYDMTGTYLDPRQACGADLNILMKDWPWASTNTDAANDEQITQI